MGGESAPTSVELDRAVELDRVHTVDQEGLPVLLGVQLRVRRGEAVAIVGRTGSGKSSLLRVILGQQPARSGSVRVLGHDLGRLDYGAAQKLRTEIGYVFERGGVWSTRTVLDNVALPLEYHAPGGQSRARALAVIAELGISAEVRRRAGEIDASERKRLLFARALAFEPRLLLVDEAQHALIHEEARFVAEAIERRRRSGMCVVYADHDGYLDPFTVDRALLLDGGRLRPLDRPLAASPGEAMG